MSKATANLRKFLDSVTDDPVEQLVLTLVIAEKNLGYVPKEMHVMASLAVAGLSGKDPNTWKLLAGIVGLAINHGNVSKEEALAVIDAPKAFLDSYAKDEKAKHDANPQKKRRSSELDLSKMPTVGKPN